ncbi:MAG: hypothetical protein WBN88_09445 [Anderseniella sp.]
MGIVYHTTETSSLQHDCRLDGPYLNCEFIQSRVRRDFDPKNLAAEIEKARSNYRANKTGMDKKECAQTTELYDAIKRGVPPKGVEPKKFAQGMEAMGEAAKQNLFQFMDAATTFCQEPTEERFISFSRVEFEKRMRTCIVSSHKYTQRFKHFPETDTWVVTQEGPLGSCGLVNVSRFQPDVQFGVKSWSYIAKKIVTNKSGNSLLLSCSDLDEGEYVYDWRTREIEFGCDFIKFGAF